MHTVTQVQAAAWLLEVEKTISGAIFADDCGLGKTLAVLAWLAKTSTTAQAPFKPTLILVPPALVSGWMDEYKMYFEGALELHLHVGTDLSVSRSDARSRFVKPTLKRTDFDAGGNMGTVKLRHGVSTD